MQDVEELLVGFRFHPTDIELIAYYLRRRIEGLLRFPNCLIQEYDVYKHEPWYLPCDTFRFRNVNNVMYFFTPRHLVGVCSQRVSRTAGKGYWRGSGKDILIKIGSKVIGHKASLNYMSLKGKEEENTGWIMQEFRLQSPSNGDKIFDDLVLCRIYEKKCSKEREQQCLMEDNGDTKGCSDISIASSQLESSSLSHKQQKLHVHSFRTSDFLSAIVRRIQHLGGTDGNGDDKHSQKRKAVDEGDDVAENSNRSKTGMVAYHSGSGSGSGGGTEGRLRDRLRGSGHKREDSVRCGDFEDTPGTPTPDRNDKKRGLKSSDEGLDAKEEEGTIVPSSSNLDGVCPDSKPSGIFGEIDLNLTLDENGDASTSTSTVA